MSTDTREAHTQESGYAFSNLDPHAVTQFDCLQRFLDPISRARMAPLLGTGARCWEVGAGGGSLAYWMAETVGPTGRVLATDIQTLHLQPRPGLEILTHDVAADPVPAGPFDLIHARLLLLHLPARRSVLRRLVDALAPGGWLVTEEFNCEDSLPILTAPNDEAAELFTRVHQTMMAVLRRKGADLGWGREVYREMLDAGLSDVDTLVHVESWSSESSGAQLHETNSRQLEPALVELGVSVDDLVEFRRLMRDPAFAIMSYEFVTTRGRRARHRAATAGDTMSGDRSYPLV